MKHNQIKYIYDKVKTPAVIPVVSGGATLYLLNKILVSDLSLGKYIVTLIALTLCFTLSGLLYGFLAWQERQKDIKIIDSIEKIVQHVFADYGASLAKGPYPVNASADKMNTILQTIVEYTKSMSDLSSKNYRK